MEFKGSSMKKKILLKGPLLTRSGYGEQARFALRALKSREDLFEIFIQPLSWGKTSWSVQMNEERKWIDTTIEKTINYIQQGGGFDLSLQVTIPNEFEKLAPINIGYTAGIETTKVAHEWILKANEMDKIIVVSNHSKDVFTNSVYQAVNEKTGQQLELKLTTPIDAVNYPVKTFASLPDIEIDVDTNFNFLAVAQFGPRKNLPNTIKWFVEEFRNDDVGLILKTNIAKNCLMDKEMLFGQLKELIQSLGEKKCKVYLLHGDMTDEEMHALYKHSKINAFLALPHGEGFGLPIFEASYSGLPVVATGWSGQLDFLVDEQGRSQFYNVAFDLQPVQKEVVWNGVLIENSMWAYPRESSAKEQMRSCYENTQEEVKICSGLDERFSADKMYKQFVDSFFPEEDATEDNDFIKEMADIIPIKDIKNVLLTKLPLYTTERGRTDLLSGIGKGKDCVIVTCGPSLNDFTEEELREKLEDKFVIAIKQGFNKVPDMVDMHLFNCNNFQPYDYSDNRPITVGCSSMPLPQVKHSVWGKDTNPDLFFRVVGGDYEQTLAKTHNFSDFTLEKTLTRPWGPGIMSELVFYLVHFMGFSSVTTIGWDLAKPGETTSHHFYEEDTLINKALPMERTEIEDNIQASLALSNWLSENNIELLIGNNNSYVHEKVKRKML